MGAVKSVKKQEKFRALLWHRDEAEGNMELGVACDRGWRSVKKGHNKTEVVGNTGGQVLERKL